MAGGRAFYGVPYFWAEMSVTRSRDRVEYASSRRWPGPAGARLDLSVKVGSARAPSALSQLDHFLTARWRLYGSLGGLLVTGRVHHEPWPLADAEVMDLEQDLTDAAGLPRPEGEPLVHHSPGVSIRLSAPALSR